MKNLYIVGGTMGVGKTTTCRILKAKLHNSVFLDGDWCWDMEPFQVTNETKAMVMDNICHLLNNFIRCSAYDNIIFCWVMHEQAIIDDIISRLDTRGCSIRKVSLICSRESLICRLKKDVRAGLRKEDVIERSLARIPLYYALNTQKIDVSNITPEQAAQKIMGICD